MDSTATQRLRGLESRHRDLDDRVQRVEMYQRVQTWALLLLAADALGVPLSKIAPSLLSVLGIL